MAFKGNEGLSDPGQGYRRTLKIPLGAEYIDTTVHVLLFVDNVPRSIDDAGMAVAT